MKPRVILTRAIITGNRYSMRYLAVTILAVMMFFNSKVSAQTPADYFMTAAENNRGLQAAYNEYEAAVQQVAQMNAIPDPLLTFGYVVSPADVQRAEITLMQMFPWFGTLKARGDVATLMAEAKYQSFIDARNLLYFQVASAYYPLFELKEWISIEEDNVRILESYKTIVTRRFESGSGTMVDVLRVDIMLKESQTNLSILRNKQKPLTTAFNKILNRSEDAPVTVVDTLVAEAFSFGDRRDSMIDVNPRLKSLDLSLQASKASELVARKGGYPTLGVGVEYMIMPVESDAGMPMPGSGKDEIMPMVSVSLPIFRRKYKAAVSETRLMQQSYTAQRQQVENTLIAEYEMSFFEIEQQLQLLSLYGQQVQTTQQSLNLLFSSYSNSGQDFEEVLRMQQELLKYKKLRATALAQYHIAVEKMNYLTAKPTQ